MIGSRPYNLSDAQLSRPNVSGATQCVDIHCHCLPGLDDGPATTAESLALCRALLDDGITTAIATPHQLGRYDGENSPARVRQAVFALRAALLAEKMPLRVEAGGDVRLDERIPSLIEADRVLTLADGGKYILIELPHEAFIDLRPLIPQLAARGITAVISHPERNELLVARPESVLPWVADGARLQVTASSLLGDFGMAAERAAWRWLGTGVATLVATDCHDAVVRRPRMSEAISRISDRLGHGIAQRVCVDNPLRVLSGRDLGVAAGSMAGEGRP